MTQKRRWGDRKDGTLLRDLDALHFITPLLYPNRCDNEAYISQRIDLTAVNQYLAEKNAAEPAFRYTLFHVIVAAMLKTLTLRPRMNRFIANKNTYQRNQLSASFVVKKEFSDNGGEGLAFVYAQPRDTLDSIHESIRQQVQGLRKGKEDSSSESMNMFNKMPRFLSKAIVALVCRLDVHGWVPQSLIDSDPYYSSVLLSNLGSLKMKCGYHHLTNWGTNSVFCIIGEKKLTPVFDETGKATMRETVELGLTIDERIADGYYYSKTIKLLQTLLEHPALLEEPFGQEVDI